MFQIHEKSLPYFIHWSSLLYLEILEEIKEQEAVEMMPKRQSVVCDGKVSVEADDDDDETDADSSGAKTKPRNKNDPKCTIFVQKGEINCKVGDYLALSPSNAGSVFRERKYIMEVKSCAGKHLYVDPVWPKRVPSEFSKSPFWKITSFPNLVSFNRMLEALKRLCTGAKREGAGIFGELLNAWSEEKNYCQANSQIGTRALDETSIELSGNNSSQEVTVDRVDQTGELL